MNDELMKLQNIKLQIKNLESQFDNLEIQMKNMNMMMNTKIDTQIESLGMQMLNLGIQILYIIKQNYIKMIFEQNQFDDKIENVRKQLKNLFYNTLNKNMMNPPMMNMNNQMNMMEQNMMNNQMNMMGQNMMNNQMNMMEQNMMNNQMNMMGQNMMNNQMNMMGQNMMNNQINMMNQMNLDNNMSNFDDDTTGMQNPIFKKMCNSMTITFIKKSGEKKIKFYDKETKLCNILRDFSKSENLKSTVNFLYNGIKLNKKDETKIKYVLEFDSIINVI